jgi:hypothetical protein
LYVSWIYNYLYNQCLSPLKLWVPIPLVAGAFDTLCDKVCQWLATGQWFSPPIKRLYHISNVVFYRKKGCFSCTVQWKYKKNYIVTICEYSFCYEIILKFKHLQVMRKFCLNILPFLLSSARQSNILLDIHVIWFPLSIRNHQNNNTTKILKASYILLKYMLLTNYSTLLQQ